MNALNISCSFFNFKIFQVCRVSLQKYHKIIPRIKNEKLSSKQIRQLFLDYFTKEKNHTYVHSSPVFLNNDPTLLFVNAGMNQFRSLLLNKLPPSHQFSKLQRAVNSQKCIRLSGKHNDLDDVGQDLHHHTFFEMLGNWSFGDYSKKEACEMAWELLTKVYGLNPDNLYVTFFGGCPELCLPADNECKNIWLNIGIKHSHIFPFGAKENFWEMGDVGPCGSCTEVHYDFLGLGPESASKRVNADRPDLIEIWNLVFIQYNREQNGCLSTIPSLNVDTGMGFERLTAVLQGSMSNYDTDIFIPIFKAIEKNFNVIGYGGQTGISDKHGIDFAYRVIADHSRMFSVAIADGLFPDNYDAGHVLRKIIRRASYAANKVMKSRPGMLSSIVPVVAECLDFFPEVNKGVKEIIEIVNEEEKLFHTLVNKGRKARNKMMSENHTDLSGNDIWKLKEIYGLEEMVIKDLASEVDLDLNWKDYETVCNEKEEKTQNKFKDKLQIFARVIKDLQDSGIKPTDDSFKYNYSTNRSSCGVENISASIVGVVENNQLVKSAASGSQCVIVTNKTNFYSEAGGQVADIGKICNEDFTFKVDHVFSSEGYIFHRGTVIDGTVKSSDAVELHVDKDHRLACSQNHTATHLLNSILRNLLSYTSQRSSYVGPDNLRLGFSAKTAFTIEQIKEIEDKVKKIVTMKIPISRMELPFEILLNDLKAVVLRGEKYPDIVSVICIGKNSEVHDVLSMEPCCGTHVQNTSDIGQFIIIPSKSHGGSTRYLTAVTGNQASILHQRGDEIMAKVLKIKHQVDNISVVTEEAISALLKEVKDTLKNCQQEQNAPLVTLEKCEKLLQELKLKLSDMLLSCNVSEKSISGDDAENSGRLKISNKVIEILQNKNIPMTDDSFKYYVTGEGTNILKGEVVAIIRDDAVVNTVKQGLNCQIVLKNTNFYAEEDDQACDIGTISSEDFVFKVVNVFKVDGYVFHDGYVEHGTVNREKLVESTINQEHRLSSSQNHTTLHILNAILRKELPYAYQQQAHASPKELFLTFSCKASLTATQLESIERKVNEAIYMNLDVKRDSVQIESLKDFPTYKLPVVKKSQNTVPTISIGDDQKTILHSVEPCYGTHVTSTTDIESFIITSSKSKSNTEKTIRAVTGHQAKIVRKDGEAYDKQMQDLEEYVSLCLKKQKLDPVELWDCVKEIKIAKAYHETELPLLLFRKHQDKLLELSKRLNEATKEFVQQGFKQVSSEMTSVLCDFGKKPYIVHRLQSVGDGKKIVNFALENSEEKPAMYFAHDGKKTVVCSCNVPKHLVKPSFSAVQWINPVASLLEGRARMLTKEPELSYSVVCSKTEKLDEAVKVAIDFVESQL